MALAAVGNRADLRIGESAAADVVWHRLSQGNHRPGPQPPEVHRWVTAFEPICAEEARLHDQFLHITGPLDHTSALVGSAGRRMKTPFEIPPPPTV